MLSRESLWLRPHEGLNEGLARPNRLPGVPPLPRLDSPTRRGSQPRRPGAKQTSGRSRGQWAALPRPSPPPQRSPAPVRSCAEAVAAVL